MLQPMQNGVRSSDLEVMLMYASGTMCRFGDAIVAPNVES